MRGSRAKVLKPAYRGETWPSTGPTGTPAGRGAEVELIRGSYSSSKRSGARPRGAAVGLQHLADHRTLAEVAEEHHGPGHLVILADPAEGDPAGVGVDDLRELDSRGLRVDRELRGVRDPGGERVDDDPIGSEFAAEGLHERDESGLRGAVGRGPRPSRDAPFARDHDDAPAAVRAHARQHCLDE